LKCYKHGSKGERENLGAKEKVCINKAKLQEKIPNINQYKTSGVARQQVPSFSFVGRHIEH